MTRLDGLGLIRIVRHKKGEVLVAPASTSGRVQADEACGLPRYAVQLSRTPRRRAHHLVYEAIGHGDELRSFFLPVVTDCPVNP